MKRSVLLILFAVFSTFAFPRHVRQLSGSAQISLITCDPGDELYSIFGHSAIRVFDDSLHINEVYNYGTFNFNTPNFYLKFANGKLDYMLSVYNFKYFLPAYFRDKRGVSEQFLNLNRVEKQRLYKALEINRLPQNKFYRYDFFFDNCATRIRDIVLSSVDGHIGYTQKDTINMTFRDMLHLYLNKQPWIRDGIDIILGSRIDRKVSLSESVFLPDYLKDYFMHANIENNGKVRPLIIEDVSLIKFDNPKISSSKLTPEFVTWMLFVVLVILTIIEKRTNRQFVIIDRLLLFITGLLGFVIFYLWFLTEHTATGANYNILWAMPTNLILFLFLKKARNSNLFKTLLYITWIPLLIVLLGWKLIPQELPASVFPVALIMLIRLSRYLFSAKT